MIYPFFRITIVRPMATKYFCDDCGKELDALASIDIFVNYVSPFSPMRMCYDCFDKHWKPVNKKFSLKV